MTVKQAADDICIETLTLRGRRCAPRTAVRALQQTRAPGVGRRWYIIRDIELRSPAHKLAETLGTDIERQMRRAVHGIYPNAEQANAIFFNSLDELLTRLSIDLLQGMGHYWYWRQWLDHGSGTTTGQQLGQLWCKYSDHLPQICLRLAQQNRLANAFLSLDANQLTQIIGAYSHDTGYSADRFISATPQQSPGKTALSPASKTAAAEGAAPSQQERSELARLATMLPATMQKGWYETVSGSANQPLQYQNLQLSLMLLISGMSWQPTLIRRWQHRWPSLVTLWREILTRTFEPADTLKRKPLQSTSFVIDPRAGEPASLTGTAQRSGGLVPEPQPQPQADPPAQLAHAAHNEQPDDPEPGDHPAPSGNEFVSEYGRLFLLINPIQRYLQRNPERLADLDRADAGWALLWQLAMLAAGADREKMVLDHGLIHCFEQAVGEEAMKTMAAVPLHHLAQDIASVLAGGGSPCPLLAAQGLKRRGHIVLSCSHLDIWFSSRQIDLDIRLAGLDINPGWVPWLGRVVHFHYRDDRSGMLDGNHE